MSRTVLLFAPGSAQSLNQLPWSTPETNVPISFEVHADRGYYVATFVGLITDDMLVTSYRAFFEGEDWRPGLDELTDLSQADVQPLTAKGLRSLGEFSEEHLTRHHIATMKTAVFASRPLSFGLAQMYKALANESPEQIQVFERIDDAMAWLLE